MATLMDSTFFSRNRNRLVSRMQGVDAIIVSGNSEMQRNNDCFFPFRQDSSFWYLTGVDEPDAVLCIDVRRNVHTIILPEKSEQEIIFDGASNSDDVRIRSGVDSVVQQPAGWKDIVTSLSQKATIGVLVPPRQSSSAAGAYVQQKRMLARLKRRFGAHSCVPINDAIRDMRMTKSTQELEALRSAARVTCEGFERVHRALNSATHEYSLEAEMTYAFSAHGLTHAYTPIVAAGKNACTLHYSHNRDALSGGEHVLLDCGAEFEYYASDVTRTYAVGVANPRRKHVWQAVYAVHQALLAVVKPGMTLIDVERHAVELIARELASLKLIESESSNNVRQYFPHAVSHFVGLDVHDSGAYDVPLEPGMVLTIEPGIYIQAEGIGVRIEDTVAVTKDGIENLTARAPY